MGSTTPTEAVDRFGKIVNIACEGCILTRTIPASPSTHPWVDDIVMRAVAAKRAAAGAPEEAYFHQLCNEVTARSHAKYVHRTIK